jgi:archaemetzincin
MIEVTLLPFGRIEPEVLEIIKEKFSDMEFKVEISAPTPIPRRALNEGRKQYLASALTKAEESFDGVVLGVTDVDLYTPGLNFVFGLANPGTGKAVISLKRLRTDAGKQKFLERSVKEAVHELGHLLGLNHCSTPGCVMIFSNTLADTDDKGWYYCNGCRRFLTGLYNQRM